MRIPANGGPRQRLGDIKAQDAAWSPDGKSIAFAQGSNLFLADDLGSPPRKLATTPGLPFWLRWSPDGKVLRFTLNDTKTGVRTLWQANLSGSIEQLFAGWKDKNYSCCGIWSPDGRFYLFLHFSEGQPQLWALREGKFESNHSEPVPVSVNQVGVTFIAHASNSSQKRLFVLGLNPLAETYAVDPKDKRPVQPLPNLPADDLIFSRDGKWVSFFSQDATKSLWRAHADGTNPTQLTSPPLEVAYPVFSPDASRIAMMARIPGQPMKIYWVNADGGTLHELRTDVTNQADPTGRQMVSPSFLASPPTSGSSPASKKQCTSQISNPGRPQEFQVRTVGFPHVCLPTGGLWQPCLWTLKESDCSIFRPQGGVIFRSRTCPMVRSGQPTANGFTSTRAMTRSGVFESETAIASS